ncbi:MAG: hypothetical protein AAF355_11300 [Myxococcota bacterium]
MPTEHNIPLEVTGIRYLPPTVIVPLNDRDVKCVAFSPDGSELAIITSDSFGQYTLNIYNSNNGSQVSRRVLAMPRPEPNVLLTGPEGLFYEPQGGRLLIVLSQTVLLRARSFCARRSELRFIEGGPSQPRLSNPLKISTRHAIESDVDFVAFGVEGTLAVGTSSREIVLQKLCRQLFFKKDTSGTYTLSHYSPEEMVYDEQNQGKSRNAIQSELDQPSHVPGSPNHVAALSLSNPRANLSDIWRYTRNRGKPLIWSCFDPKSKISCLLYANGTVILAFEDNVYISTRFHGWFGAKPIRAKLVYWNDRLHLLGLHVDGRALIYEISSHNSEPTIGPVVAKMRIPPVQGIRRLVVSSSGSIAYCLRKGPKQITITHPG